MAIRVSYTPYGAVGGLAEHAGQAQQAIREQQYAEQEARQAESIAAQERMQAGRIEAGREEWQRKLTTQQEQFAMSQAVQQEEMFRRQQASEFATMKQAQTQRAQIAAQEQQFEQNIAMKQQQMVADVRAKEQAFELKEAQEARLLQSAQATTQAQQMRRAFDFEKLETAKGAMADNIANWEKLQGQMPQAEYVAGLAALSTGKLPQLSPSSNAAIEENRRLNIEKKKLAMAAGLTDRGRTVAQEVFDDVLGKAAGGIRGFFTGADESELIDSYESYQAKTGYDSKNDAGKRELDNIFDRSIIDYENKGWFEYYSAWDPESKAVKNLRIQSKGVINDEDATKFMNKAIAANPDKSMEECKSIAIDMALKAGYKL